MTHSSIWIILEAVYQILVSLDFVSGGVSCLSNPCFNGICIDDISSNYSCYCIDGYTGIQCQTNWDECWSAPCKNGGTCIDGIASYNCSCAEGFVGDNCEVNYNECESSPCHNNATCVDLTNGYVCACAPGYSGALCELDIAVCNATDDVRCLNGGQCVEGRGFKYSCKCLPGWSGEKCEEATDECASSPCQNGGICIDMHADYMCACTFGHTGKSCETHIEFCADNSCSNNALCVLEGGATVCYCVPDYHGERCQYQYDECQLGPRCMNGGTCIDGVDNFTCSCPPRLTGLLCECLVLDDASLDCEYVSPTPVPGSSSISTITTTDEELTSIFMDLSTTTYLPDTTNNYTTTALSKSTTWEITTDLTTLREIIITLLPEIPETTTYMQTDTTLFDDETTARTATTSYPNQTVTYAETTTALTERTLFTLQPENSITELVSHCGEVCQESSSTTLTTRETTVLPETTTITTTSQSTTESEDTTVSDVTTKQTTAEPRALDTTTVGATSTLGPQTTTESLFTDSPTGPPEGVTVELTSDKEFTTEFDNQTEGYTTVSSECSDTYCNDRGTCVQTPHGFRCVCNLNYGGEFCEERVNITSVALAGNSYLAHKVPGGSAVHVAFTARTLVADGQVMRVDIAPGIYVQLYLDAGLLKFKFSCGYQTMLLTELKTFLNNGFYNRIEMLLDLDAKQQHCNATLRLNDTVAMSGGQVANITALRPAYTLYLGNAPAPADHRLDVQPFVGCVQDLVVNGSPRHVVAEAWEAVEARACASLPCLSAPCLNGGSCLDRGARYTCACANGFLGEQCERSVCEQNPCQFGGTCVRYPGSGFLCLCPFGKHGMFCEYNLDITRPSFAPTAGGLSSYVVYPLPQASSDTFELSLRFHTGDMEQIALLAFVGQAGRHDAAAHHLAVTFVKGYVMLTWNLGSGPRRIFTPRPLSERRAGGHTVRVGRRGRGAWLAVDARFNVSGNAPGANARMDVAPYLYIGGHPSVGLRDLPHDLPLHRGWTGCAWPASGSPAAGRGAGQCGVAQCPARACTPPNGVCVHHPATYSCICAEGWYGATCAARHSPCDAARTQCRGLCVLTAAGSRCDCPYGKTGRYCEEDLVPTDVLLTGDRSYVRLRPRRLSSASVALEAEIRPLRPRGLVLFADTPAFSTALSLHGGLLEYRWTDKTSGIVSVVRSGVVVSTGQWHTVKAGRYGSRLYVWADGTIATQNMAAHTYPHTAANTTLALGGDRDLASLPHDAMSGPPESYAGCLRNLHVDNVLLPLEPHNIQEGMNVEDCDGTACGEEACGGGACHVVDGRATCACAGAAGTRCRRAVPCSAAACAPPRGRCRRDACVCAAGYAGANCTQEIDISVPQFSGDSLMVIRPVAGEASGQMRAQAAPRARRFDYIGLNFTTADPDGVLVWAQVNTSYVGVGLEEGYLKIIWSTAEQSQPAYETLDEETTEREWGGAVGSGEARPAGAGAAEARLAAAGALADAEWHRLRLWLNADNVTVSVDGRTAHLQRPGASRHMDARNLQVFIGGVSAESSPLAVRAFGKNFRGCIDRVGTATSATAAADHARLYSENVRSCQLLP